MAAAALIAGLTSTSAQAQTNQQQTQQNDLQQDSEQQPYRRVWSRKDPGLNRSSSPVIADIDRDGVNEIVIGHQDGMLRAYEGNGSLIWRSKAIPRPDAEGSCSAQSTPSSIESSPAAADIDHDGEIEVIVGVGSTTDHRQNGTLISFNGINGEIEWTFEYSRDIGSFQPTYTTNLDGWCEVVYTTPAIGDVNGDGRPDIVFGGFDLNVWAVNGKGEPLPGFPFDSGGMVWSSPALFDMDDDNDMEIFIGNGAIPIGSMNHLGGIFKAIDYRNGEPVEMWQRFTNEVFHSSPAIGDINEDGRFEAVVGMGRLWHEQCSEGDNCPTRNAGSQHTQVWAFHLDDGTDVPGWPVAATDSLRASPAIGDVDADGQPEVVLGSYNQRLYAWNGNGTIEWDASPQFSHPTLTSGRLTGHPIIVDVDGDGDQDIVVGTDIGIAFLDGKDGATLDGNLTWQRLMGFGIAYETAPAVGQFGDTRLIIAAGFDDSEDFTLTSVYELPTTLAKDAWPMFRYSAIRQGTASTSQHGHGAAERYTDIADAGVHRTGIEALLKAGILTRTECEQGFFCSDSPIQRWVMAVWLVRALDGEEPRTDGTTDFADVNADEWWTPYVARLAELEITKGCGTKPARYCPEKSVTRSQMATFIKRAFKLPATSSPTGFVDISDSVHAENIDALAAAGITGGCKTTPLSFCPDRPTGRGQMSTFLARALNLIALPSS